MREKLFAVIAVAAMTLVGCAGRDPQPVAAVQPGDSSLDCAAIEAEVSANNKTVQGLASEQGGKVVQNVTAGIVGLFIWPVWFAMDFKGAASKEEEALQSRQQYLVILAGQKNCGAAPSRPTVAAVPPPIAQAGAPVMVAAPLPYIAPMTPCGEDRPCSGTSVSVSPR